MSRLRHGTMLVALLTVPIISARAEPPPVEVVARFHDGTTIRKAVLQQSVEVTTKYGKLTVPVADILRVDFGFRLTDDVARQVERAIKQLGSDQFGQRESASKELVGLGYQAYPALEAAARSSDKEIAERARAALERIRETVPEDELRYREDDVILTPDNTLTGHITAPVLKARTSQFGEMEFKLADLRSLRSMATTRKELTVEAARFSTEPGVWLDTGFVVHGGMGLILTATGQVDLVPQQAGQVVSGPEGNPNGGTVGAYPAGALLARIGDKGDVVPVGKRNAWKSTQRGKLYLYVVPTGNGMAPTGNYSVKVTSGYELPIPNPPAMVLPPGPTSPGAPNLVLPITGGTVLPVPPPVSR